MGRTAICPVKDTTSLVAFPVAVTVKENVVGITSALDKINQLRPVNFNFIGKSVKLDGFLAHEVQAVVPYAVTGDKDAVKTVKDGDTSDEGTKEDAERIAALPTKEVAALQQWYSYSLNHYKKSHIYVGFVWCDFFLRNCLTDI